MNIIYRKNTLYVYVNEEVNDELIDSMENRVNNILGCYDIDNLVINTGGESRDHFNDFESRYNQNHKYKVIIK
jgi:hypothetical protein